MSARDENDKNRETIQELVVASVGVIEAAHIYGNVLRSGHDAAQAEAELFDSIDVLYKTLTGKAEYERNGVDMKKHTNELPNLQNTCFLGVDEQPPKDFVTREAQRQFIYNSDVVKILMTPFRKNPMVKFKNNLTHKEKP